jgi:uncharacterized protein
MRNDGSWRSDGLSPWLLILLILPFYLNDFASIFIDDWRVWLTIDYLGVKLLPLALVLWLVRSGRVSFRDLGLIRQGPVAMVAAFLLLTLVGTLIDQNGYRLLEGAPGYPPLGGMPPITSPAWDWIDLTFGLLLVGIVEELVFRGVMLRFLRSYTQSTLVIVVVSAVAFGLIHWSLGLTAVLVTTAIGAVFMIAYIRTGALLPVMLAHFAVNFIDFAGVVPKSLFQFS